MRANLCCYVCQNMRNMTFCSATNDQHQPIHPLTHAETYAASRTHLNQLPAPTNQHRHACPDIRNTTDTPQTTTLTGRPAPSRMSRHTQHHRYPHSQRPPADITTTCACSDIRNHPQPHNRRRHRHRHPRQHRHHRLTRQASAIDHLDRDIRRRITARVWRAAAPRRPRSSSTRAG